MDPWETVTGPYQNRLLFFPTNSASHWWRQLCLPSDMKIAVGIIGLVLSMIALMQSCTITSLPGLTDDQTVGQAGALGMLTAILMFFGGAFAFGLPIVARILFVLGFLASIPAREAYPDMWVWGIASGILAVLLLFVKSKKTGSATD